MFSSIRFIFKISRNDDVEITIFWVEAHGPEFRGDPYTIRYVTRSLNLQLEDVLLLEESKRPMTRLLANEIVPIGVYVWAISDFPVKLG